MTDTGKCPAFGYDCEYAAKVEAQEAEIQRLREALHKIIRQDHHNHAALSASTYIARAALGEME